MPQSQRQRQYILVHQKYIHFQWNAAFAWQHCVAEAVAVCSVWCIPWIYQGMHHIVRIDSLTEMVAEGEC
jgi:hypothetical protein